MCDVRGTENEAKVEFEEWLEVLHTRPVSEGEVFTMIERYNKIDLIERERERERKKRDSPFVVEIE